MSRKMLIYWLIQIASWGIIVLLIGIGNYLQDGYSTKLLTQVGLVYTLLIASSHTIRTVFIKQDWFILPMATIVWRTLLLIVLLSTSWLVIFDIFTWTFFDEELRSIGVFFISVLLYSIFLILWSAVYLSNHLFHKSRVQELNNLKLQTTQSQNELKSLRDQLNPHFLFNSLNNIRALVEIDPNTAKYAITTLSSLLRNSLQLGKKTFIALIEELQLVKEYLELEKIRFEERLHYDIDNQEVESIQIPPFIIQSMVENAIKHGISKSASAGKIDISVYSKDDLLILEVVNDGEYAKTKSSGIGMANTIRRLEILYGPNAGFEIYNIQNKVKAFVWINKEYINKLQHESSNH